MQEATNSVLISIKSQGTFLDVKFYISEESVPIFR